MNTIRLLMISLYVAALAGTAYAAPSGADLNRAMLFQDVPKIKELISQGADVNYKEAGRPLIVWAGQNATPEIIKILLDAKANVNDVDDGLGHTALMRAVDVQNLDNVKALLAAKADPNITAPNGETALTLAIRSDKPEIVQAVVNAGANVKTVTGDGETPVLTAAMSGQENSGAIIKILAKAGADLNRSNILYNPLAYAVQHGDAKVVAALLEAGADANAKSESGKTPIEFADNKEIVDLLIKAKADPNRMGESGTTPLIRAVQNGDLGLVESLVKGGANPTTPDQYGNSPLQVANNYSQTDIAEFLKKSGATQ